MQISVLPPVLSSIFGKKSFLATEFSAVKFVRYARRYSHHFCGQREGLHQIPTWVLRMRYITFRYPPAMNTAENSAVLNCSFRRSIDCNTFLGSADEVFPVLGYTYNALKLHWQVLGVGVLPTPCNELLPRQPGYCFTAPLGLS